MDYIEIGGVKIEKSCALSPMASVADEAYRLMCKEYGASLVTSEMVSAKGLCYNFERSAELCQMSEAERPYAIQLFGEEPEFIARAVRLLGERGFKPDMIDINMGCPVKKVVGGQDGCSLMRNPKLASDLVKAVKDGTDKPVSVKFRLGYTMDELNFVEYGQKMQNSGAEFITIHARTRSQMYSGKADWKLVKKLKENVDIPVFVNGDIVSIETAVQALEESSADGVAIGRGMLGDPTLIKRIEHYLKTGEKLPPPLIEERIALLKYHIDEEIKLRGENVGIKFMRKFYPYYLSGFKNAKVLRTQLVLEEDYDKIIQTLENLTSAQVH